ncbi:LuxR C-terminal-related transcriptional regulator [Olavius algarvensis spirochete endosymbiont]|uniref:LuxR C-terminal-related transcriptional regulator n=1 Tax=Olavius algarvensis spirochete endosymbiont TaxID=260710 RepID=UPI000F51A0A8|nr:LuxR C-terminal-related transcriptional regulator [Olavius algarvensis spirochete endosymbiont]
MIDHIFLFIYIFAVGATFSAVSMSLLYWLRQRNTRRLNTFLFISYLAILLLLAGVRFYWAELLSGGRGVTIGTGMAEFAGYALLLYYLPATVNHIIARNWTWLRRIASIIACAVYFALGAVYLLTGFLRPISIAAGFLYFLALGVILVDIVRSASQIKGGPTRVTVLLITLLTVIFLPLVMASRLLGESGGIPMLSRSIRFLFLSLYYFWMATAGIVFYVREMSVDIQVSIAERSIPETLPLTERERDIARSIVQGLTHVEIALNLGISPNTVRNHVSNFYKKLSVRSKVELLGVLRGERSY